MDLIDWIAIERQRIENHHAAFSAVSRKQPDGLTLFQHQALSVLAPLVPPDSFRRVADEGGDTDVLVAPLGAEGTEVRLYDTDTGVFGPEVSLWLEECEFQTPEDLFDTLVKEVGARAAA